MFVPTALLVLHAGLFVAAHGGVRKLRIDNRMYGSSEQL